MLTTFVRVSGVAAVALAATAATFNVTINTSVVSPGHIKTAFDVVSNNPNRNSISITNYHAPGTTMGLPESTGGTSEGDLATILNPAAFTTLSTEAFYNNFVINLNPIANTINFTINLSELGPLTGNAPDLFAFYLLDSSGLPLITTTDPLGTNALFTFEMTGVSGGVVNVYGPAVRTGNNIFIVIPGGDPPTIVSPANGSALTSSAVGFQWGPAPGSSPANFDFKLVNISASAGAFGALNLFVVSPSSQTNTVYTTKSGSYRLEMKACAANGACSAPSTSLFTLTLPAVPSAAPVISSCTVVNDTGQNRLNCTWGAVDRADFYFINVVQAGAGPGGGALTVAGTQIGGLSSSFLIPNGNMSVLVRGCNGDGCGPLSGAFGVTASFANASAPLGGEPFSGSLLDPGSFTAPSATFTWSRVAGDTGSSHRYRLYVQDFSRNAAAVDVITTNNFHGAFLNPFTRYDWLVIAIPNSGAATTQGPAQSLLTRGKIPNSPVFTVPTTFSTVSRVGGLVRVAWTPVPNIDGSTVGRLYQYFVGGASSHGGTTTNTFVDLPLTSGAYSGTVRVCNTGQSCVTTSSTGWGPYNNTATGEGGPTSFTVI
jgi:hypothetical protein